MKFTRRRILRNASALSALAVGASGMASAANCSGINEWQSGKAYSGGDQVVYDGSLWEAEWWTQGDEPGSGGQWGPWTEVGPCDGDGGGGGDDGGSGVDCSGVQQWDSSTAYNGGDQVVYDGALWTAEWWTRGNEPATSSNVWTREGTCGDGGGGSGGGNESPNASFTASPSSPDPGESVTFDASGSSDADGAISSYEWDLGDGNSATGESVTHTYESDGSYTVTLTVTDDEGATATDSTTVSVRTDGGGGTGDHRVVAYWMQWAQFDREYVPADIPTDKVTHLQYAFMKPESDGSISGLGDTYSQRFLFPESWHDVTTFGDISDNNDVKCVISLGGWGDSENFSDAALTESSRQTFAEECVRIVREANVDGVDIDWEYPGGGGHPDNTVRDGDQERFTLLLEATREALDAAGEEDGEDYLMTAAMVADPEKAAGLEHGRISELLDFASIMTFDYRGGFSGYTGHASPLYANPDDPSETSATWNVSSALEWYVDQGWDPEQLNMATPFYGRSFASVEAPGDVGNGVDDGLFQNFSGTGSGSFPPDTSDSGVFDYWDIATSGGERSTSQVDLTQPGWETMYDDTAVAAYSYNADEELMISHETPQTVEEKMNWIQDEGYGGTMLWALSHDTVDHTLLNRLSNTLL